MWWNLLPPVGIVAAATLAGLLAVCALDLWPWLRLRDGDAL